MNIQHLLEGIELPEGMTHDRVMSVRTENGLVSAIEVIEVVPPTFQGHYPCPWDYEARRDEQVVRYARKKRHRIIIIRPSGNIEVENA